MFGIYFHNINTDELTMLAIKVINRTEEIINKQSIKWLTVRACQTVDEAMFIPVVFQIKVVENWKTLNDWNWLLLHLLKQIAVAVTFDWLLMASLLRLFVCATSAEFLWFLNQGECYLNRLWVPYCHQTYFCHLLAVQHVSLNTNDQISTQALCVLHYTE